MKNKLVTAYAVVNEFFELKQPYVAEVFFNKASALRSMKERDHREKSVVNCLKVIKIWIKLQ